MGDCEHLMGGKCGLVASLAGIELELCDVRQDACAACLATAAPRQLNSVTASLAIGTAARHLDHDRAAAIRNAFGSHLTVIRKKVVAGGPGSELKKLLGWLGIKPTANCQCNARARDMDLRGPDWCESNQGEILAWLREEAGRRGLPFVEIAAKSLVRLAIRRARAEA